MRVGLRKKEVIKYLCMGVWIIICLQPLELFAQKKEYDRQYIIKALSNYRTYILNKDAKNIYRFLDLKSRINQIATSEEDSQEILNVLYKILYCFSCANIEERTRKFNLAFKDSPYHSVLYIDDIEILQDIKDLRAIFNIGLLEESYPFKFDETGYMFNELLAYEIEEGDRIGEIGAGSGDFSILLLSLIPDLEIYINELKKEKIQLIEQAIDIVSEERRPTSYKVIKGSAKSTNLEGLHLDKIIIRNSFHHFTKRNKMLASIKKSLSQDGKLYIRELLKSDDYRTCKYSLTAKKIRETLIANGYLIEDELKIGGGAVLFICKLDV